MRMQSSQANCGPTALYNAGCALGKKLDLNAVEKACRTTATEGTSARKMKSALERLGFHLGCEIRESRDEVATLFLRNWLDCGYAVVITVDGDSHWVAAVGRMGCQYLLADSADNELVIGLSEGELVQRWRNPETKRGFYGLAVQ